MNSKNLILTIGIIISVNVILYFTMDYSLSLAGGSIGVILSLLGINKKAKDEEQGELHQKKPFPSKEILLCSSVVFLFAIIVLIVRNAFTIENVILTTLILSAFSLIVYDVSLLFRSSSSK